MDIIIDNVNVKTEICKLLDVCVYDIDICMCLLFEKLGFNEDDKINIIDIDNKGNVNFILNNEINYDINIRRDNSSKYPLIYFKNNDGIEYGYQCIFREVKGYISLSVNNFKSGYKINDSIVNYEVDSDFVEYSVRLLDKILEFRLSKPSKYINKNGYFVSYEIPRHRGVVNYLSKLDNFDSIIDIYSDLYRLIIGNDIYKYDNIDLRIINVDDYNNYNVNELIQLDNGNVSFLNVKRNGYEVSYSNGRWICDNSRLQVMYEQSNSGRIKSLNTRINVLTEDSEYNDNMIFRDIVSSDNEVNNVKKLVRSMFVNRDSD